MKKIGIIGSDNSHALHFAKIINLPGEDGKKMFPDYEVTHIFGMDEKENLDRAKGGAIANIVKDPQEIIDAGVDGVVVVFRHGDLHLKYALPFIKAGIPVFVDKPFTIKTEEAFQLVEAAEEYNTPITGGSTYKYIEDVLKMKEEFDNCRVEKTGMDTFISGFSSFTIDPDPLYGGGVEFYGPHTIEPALIVFGYDVKAVYATQSDRDITAILKYDNYQITLNLLYDSGIGFHMGIFKKKTPPIIRKMDGSKAYIHGVTEFLKVIESGETNLNYDQIILPVAVANMIRESINKGMQVDMDEYLAGFGCL